jgi:hypothetical protein
MNKNINLIRLDSDFLPNLDFELSRKNTNRICNSCKINPSIQQMIHDNRMEKELKNCDGSTTN